MPQPEDAVETVLARLGQLIGLAPGEVARRRLERHEAVVERALRHSPHIDDPAWAAVIDAVTVQETRLFRHPAQCRLLEEEVLPPLITAAMQRGARTLRLLSAGCASGEEAWTLAAIATAAIRRAGASLACDVLGLDLSRPALHTALRAQLAEGPPDPLRDVPPAFHPFFPRDGAGVAVSGALRARARFRRANLLDLEVGGPGFDVVTCRNVGIYLTPEARAAIMHRLGRHLVPGGALMLGPTDFVPGDAGLAPWSRDSVSLFRREDLP